MPLDLAPHLSELRLYPFRYFDDVRGRWVRARYVAELPEIAARYSRFEIIGPPEVRYPNGGGSFNPFR